MFGWRPLLVAGLMLATGAATYAALGVFNAANRAARAPSPGVAAVRQVDSAPDGYPLERWPVGGEFAGWVDQARYADAAPVSSRPAVSSDILELSGWAGDPVLGARAGYVFAAACGIVFAAAKTGVPRPDVVASVHPNLENSGWEMSIYAGHVPICESDAITFYATFAPFRLATPMREPLMLPRAAAGPSATAAPRAASALPLPPAAPPAAEKIDVRAELTLRRCAANSCDVAGRVPRGAREIVVVERRGDWALIVDTAAQAGGWVVTQTAGLAAAAR